MEIGSARWLLDVFNNVKLMLTNVTECAENAKIILVGLNSWQIHEFHLSQSLLDKTQPPTN